jgi:erythromycin esterase
VRARRAFVSLTTVACAAALIDASSFTAAPRQALSGPPAVHSIRASDGADFSDLQFLKPLLAGARIVQLGENSHGTAEPTVVRARLARFLHQELGFNVIAFESSLFLGHRGDARIATASPQSVLTASLVGVWHTREMLPLFDYMKSTRAGAAPLRLAGFDVQPIGSGKRERPQFFADLIAIVNGDYAAEVKQFDAAFVAELDKGGSARREYLRANAAALIKGYERLAAFVDEHGAAIGKGAGREAALVAAQEARSMAAYVRFQTAPDMKDYAETRDRGMADNVIFLAERLFPNQKIIVWGHNYHLRYDNGSIAPRAEVFPGVAARSMGGWVRERFGSAVYTVGQYEHEGRSVDNARVPYDIAPAPDGSLERRLGAAGSPPSFVDLKTAASLPGFAWFAQPIAARFNGQHEQTLVPVRQYDAVLFLGRVSPVTFLY